MHPATPAPPSRGTPSRRGRSPRTVIRDGGSPTTTSAGPPEPSNKPAATFTSSMSIAVEGSLPVDRLANRVEHVLNLAPSAPPNGETKRAPRKSKTDALAALNARSHSPLLTNDESEPMDIDRVIPTMPLNGAAIAVPLGLDMSSVKTLGPRDLPPRIQPRPFGLEDCPSFFPTAEEFKDPMAYIRSISDRARKYGICKVVPPEGWKMPFVTDTKSFRFKTRLQRLNSIEASSRAKLNFLEALYRFHKQQGNPRVTVPTINHKPLDLWLLRKEVHKLGGYDAVNKGKKWADLGGLLGYGGIPGLSTQLRNSYIRVILPYENFSERVRNSPTTSPRANGDVNSKAHGNTHTPSRMGRVNSNGTSADAGSAPSSPLTVSSSPLSEPPDDSEINGASSSHADTSKIRRVGNGSVDSLPTTNMNAGTNGVPTATETLIPSPLIIKVDAKPEVRQEQTCEVCNKKNRETEMLLCDGCDCGFHTFCLNPPLSTIPKGQWFCHTCLFGTGGDFGFDEGEEHSLSSFQARDLAFRRMWFETHPPPPSSSSSNTDPTVNRIGNATVSEFDVENEFWRLVQSSHETVEIEYGADVHSTTHGSAMPTLETHPLDPYSRDGWNLNNIPIVSDSLLRFIKSDISGMTVPWTYVGMVFSTFCWHNEDHYTYSINFMHWGETKTWYGIPGEDAEKFEDAIRREAPDLFESQPDLLFQLVTLMNPARLIAERVRVYACNQRAGEFVITFPKAYHAGFNHGLNFNEAVNFALPDWLDYGRKCVERYKEHRKHPVFSHDELLITITQQSNAIKTALWLDSSLQEMTVREMDGRRKIRLMNVKEVLESQDHPEDQYQCTICKAFCYLSQVVCPCPKMLSQKVVCLDHAELLCDCPMSQRTLRLRFSDEELINTQRTISARAAIPSTWQSKFKKLLKESPRPSLRALRALLAEGDRINHPLPELRALRKCVTRAEEWVESANSFTTRKQSRKRSRRSKGSTSSADGMLLADDPLEKPDRGLDELYTLLDEVETLGFDTPEIDLLRKLSAQAEDFKVKARGLLDSIPDDDRSSVLQDCEALLAHGSSLNVNLDELYKIENIVLQEQLIKELRDVDDNSVTLEEVRQLLSRARACSLPPDNKYMKILESRLQAGNDWDQRAADVLAQTIKTIPELDQFTDVESSIPVDPTVLSRLMSARAKAQAFERQAKAWLSPEPAAILPRVQEALRLVYRAEKEFNIPAIEDLKRTAEFAHDLEDRCEAVLRNRYDHREEVPIFDTMQKWRTYAREHLAKFSLPSYDKLNKQLELHEQWIQKLPWYCTEHERPHGTEVLEDVLQNTNAEDDAPPNDEYFTCICFIPVRPPPPGQVSDAVQCDHCYARFHGICAANGGSCPFCDPHHWNGSIHKDRSWHFCYLPTVLQNAPEVTKNYSDAWKQLDVIVRRVDRLSSVIGQFLSFASQQGNQRPEYIPQVRHYMRKLYKMQFAVSPNPEVSFGLDLAGLHRILAGRPLPIRMKKRRRPKFIFGQDVDQDWLDATRCICRGRTPYLRGYPTVQCESCTRLYHIACVFYNGPPGQGGRPQFTCPLCSLRKGRTYRYAEVRVKSIDDPYEDTNLFVDIKACLENFSKDLVRIRLAPPTTQTLFVDLMQFTPGQPDNASVKPQSSQANTPIPTPRSQPVNGHSHSSTRAPPTIAPARPDIARNTASSSSSVPPPPPWSRSETQVVTSAPIASAAESAITPNKKRKHSGDDRPLTPDSISAFEMHSSPKRKVPSQALARPSSTHRPVSNLSPSLSKMLATASPVASPHHSPSYQPRPHPHPTPSRPSPPHVSTHWSPPSPPAAGSSHLQHGRSAPPVSAPLVDETSPVPTPPTAVRKVKLLVRDSQHRERDGLQEPLTMSITSTP